MFKLFNSYIYIRQNLPPAGTHINSQHTTNQHTTSQTTSTNHFITAKGVQLRVRLGLVLLVQGHVQGHNLNKRGWGYITRLASVILLAGLAFFWGREGEQSSAVLWVSIRRGLCSTISFRGGSRTFRVLGWGLWVSKECSPSYDGCPE
jgi:hypothetical protein